MTQPLARFATRRKIRFGDCDPAGIVFYPRYFEMLNGLVEDWFEAIGFPFADTHLGQKLGTPIRAIQAEFLSSSRLGDVLDLHLELEKVGRTSATVTGVFTSAGQERFRARCTMVHVDLERGEAVPWPPAVRQAMTGSSAG